MGVPLGSALLLAIEKNSLKKIIIWRNGKFFDQKTMKTFIYVYNTALLMLVISKEDFKGFLKPLQAF